jgi:hypothetical protein
MTLKQEIEATIAAYQEACKDENLNFEYCLENELYRGICLYSSIKGFNKLNLFVRLDIDMWITEPPFYIKNNDVNAFKLIHQARLKYLQNLLNSLPND